jgi:uncharacterized protein YjeT (DUF2065 family)
MKLPRTKGKCPSPGKTPFKNLQPDAARFLIHELMPRLPDFHLKFFGSHIKEWIRKTNAGDNSSEGLVTHVAPYLHKAMALVVPLGQAEEQD